MVAPRLFKRFGKRVSVKSNSVDLLLKSLDDFDQARVTAKLEQRLVEVEVGVEHGEHVVIADRSCVSRLDFFECGKPRRRNRKRQNPHCHNFQFLAHGIDLHHLLGCEIAHDGAAIGNTPDDALFFQLEQSEPNVTAVCVELFAKILLDEALTRVTPT